MSLILLYFQEIIQDILILITDKMKYEKRKKAQIKKKKLNILRDKKESLNDIIELNIVAFIEFYEKKFDFDEKDLKILIDSSIISLFGNIIACKIVYSVKVSLNDKDNHNKIKAFEIFSSKNFTFEKRFTIKTNKSCKDILYTAICLVKSKDFMIRCKIY